MITAVDILDEVEAETTALNGEIVRRAYHGHCCKFVNNQEEFGRVLRRYVDHRLAIHHLRIQENRSYRIACINLANNHYARLHHHTELTIVLRRDLKQMWPCVACIWLFNPTGRLSRFPQIA